MSSDIIQLRNSKKGIIEKCPIRKETGAPNIVKEIKQYQEK
jgi:hypothetical protein